MISTRRVCFSVSGPGTPSRRRSVAPRIEVSGERSSCENFAKNSSFVSSICRSWAAIELNERASWPISSALSIGSGSRKEPAATSAVAAESVSRECVIR